MDGGAYRVISVARQPEWANKAVDYLTAAWPAVGRDIYADSVTHGMDIDKLPQWYLLLEGDAPVGCAGLIINDFSSRQDLWPWLAAVYVAPEHRGRQLGGLLIEQTKRDAARLGYKVLYLSTDLEGYYEQFGFERFAVGYHAGGAAAAIYRAMTGGNNE